MATSFSKTQIDHLGIRLKETDVAESDLRLLDDYRLSFSGAFRMVVRTIREQLRLEPTGRPAKSRSSLVDKLRRESVRLSQVQDIAGCRVIVEDIAEQDLVVASLRADFSEASVVDRRVNPSHGYRAVHVIVGVSGKPVEIQVRTLLQQRWAELSEKFADMYGPALKYGGGNPGLQSVLMGWSELVSKEEYEVDEPARMLQYRVILSQDIREVIAEMDNPEDEQP